MLSRQNTSKKTIFCHFFKQNDIIGNYFHQFSVISQNQNCPDKTVFNNMNKLNHSSMMNNTVTNKIENIPQLFALGPQTPLKKWDHFSSQSNMNTKLDI